MPDGYEDLRLQMSCEGIAHENVVDIYRAKINVLGGISNLSAENVNKSNTKRSENLVSFIKDSYPYIKTEEETPKNEPASIENMIDVYKKMMQATQE